MRSDTPSKVILILNYPPDRQQSMLRFGAALAGYLQLQGMKAGTWTCPQWFGHWVRHNSLGGMTKWLGYLDKFALGSLSLLWCRLRNPGAVWHVVDHGNAIYGFLLPWNKVVVTCHDCIAIEEAFAGRTGQQVGRFGKFFQSSIVAALGRVGLVAAVSEATRADLHRLTGTRPERIAVIPNGLLSGYGRLDPELARDRLVQSTIPIDQPFIFMIGSNLLRKNRQGAIRAFDSFRRLAPDRRMRLVMAGEAWSDDIREAARQTRFAADIIEAGTLSDAVLEAAYNAAALVIFPSLAEGFGLPIIEAQVCGGLVVASDIAPLPEVGGDGAIYADPRSPEAFAEAMAQALEAGDALRARGFDNARRFGPAAWADACISAYRRLAD